MKKILLFAFSLFSNIIISAQVPYFKTYHTREGLIGSEFYDISQDKRGLLWIASNQGISSFDGYRFKNYGSDEGLKDENIIKFFHDKRGGLWCISKSGNIAKIKHDSISALYINDQISKTVGTRAEVNSVAIDKGDTIWIGLINHDFILKLTPVNGDYVLKRSTYYEKAFVKIIDSRVMVYGFYNLVNSNKLTIDLNGDTFETVLPEDLIGKKRLKINYTQYRNAHFLSINNVLYKISNKQLIRVFNEGFSIEQIYSDREEDLLVASVDKGLFKLNLKENNTPSVYSFINNIDISCVYQDKELGLWCGSQGQGLFYFPFKYTSHLSVNQGLVNENINCLINCKNKNIVAGSNNGYLTKIQDGKIIAEINLNLNSFSKNPVLSLFEDNEGRIWVGCLHSTYIIDKSFKISEPIKHNGQRLAGIRSFVQTDDQSIWAGGWNNLIRISKIDNRLEFDDYPIRLKINILAKDYKNDIWIGANSGLWKFNERFLKFYGFNNKYLKSKITNLLFSTDGHLWVGTQNTGIMDINNGVVKHYTQADGLIDNSCKALMIDHLKNVWMASPKGISKLSDVYHNKANITNYNAKNALVTDEVNTLWEFNGNVWITSNKGISVIQKNRPEPDNYIPSTFISSFKSNDISYSSELKNSFKYYQNNIEIEFLAVSFKSNAKIRYRYKLTGADNDWIYTTTPIARYPDLHAGEFKFAVQAESPNGQWGNEGPLISFSIAKPLWLKWWFVALYSLIATGTIIVIYSHRIKRKHQKELERAEIERKLIDLELQALRAQMNPHFIFNCINSIQHFILNNHNEEAHKYLSKFARLMRNVLDTSKSATIPLEKELLTLELYLQLEMLRFDGKFDFRIIIDPALDVNYLEIPSMLIQPYIENSIWHGLMHKVGTGNILVKMESMGTQMMKCVIEDDGVGREKAREFKSKNKVSHKSVGMMITKERLELLNTVNKSNLSISITDLKSPDNKALGTRVEIFIPIN